MLGHLAEPTVVAVCQLTYDQFVPYSQFRLPASMLDKDIRPKLKDTLVSELVDAVIFDEMPLCRRGRADVAVVNCALWGFEIKSDQDSLSRLPTQIGYYDQIFDYSVAVVAPKHLKGVQRMLPAHWGIRVTSDDSNPKAVTFEKVRAARRNSNVSKESLIRLLWKNEATKILRQKGMPVPQNALVREIWELLSELDQDELSDALRDALKARRRSAAVE